MNIFHNFIHSNEIFVKPNDWISIKENYSQEFIIKQLSDAIVEYNIKLPYQIITHQDMVDSYNDLMNFDSLTLIKNGKWVSKFEYKYHFNEIYIDLSSVGAKASNYFHQVERWKCDATGYPSPQKTWEKERFRITLLKALFSLKVSEINPHILRNIISLRKYIAPQFRPSAAKAIYDYFKAERVLDFSMGWGDRLLAAHTSKYVKKYIGFDPNKNLYSGYLSQIEEYNKLNLLKKEFVLYPLCAEDENIDLSNEQFDLIFTSPPYFDKEKYDQSDRQSYKRYKKFDDWLNNFLCKTIELRIKNLKVGGYLVINISDIYTRKKLYKICDGMNNFIHNNLPDMKYIGAIGYRMPKRPQSISSDQVGIYGEPMWVYQKIS